MLFYAAALQTLNYDWDTLSLLPVEDTPKPIHIIQNWHEEFRDHKQD